MRTYARIYAGAIVEFITLEDAQDITTMFHPDFIWIEITGLQPAPLYGWLYDGSVFSEPPPVYVDPRPAIMAELDQIDRSSARPLRVLIIADPSIGEGTAERAELETMELRAVELRAQLAELDE